MMNSCKAPTCEYSKRWKKCVKPNCYIEALAWCKRQRITPRLCKKNYKKEEAQEKACDRYFERIGAKSLSSKSSTIQSQSTSHHIFLTDVYDTAASKISKFIKSHVMLRSETLQNRINYFKSIQYYLKNVPYYNCLTPKKYTSKDGHVHNGFDFDTTLKLTKQIGSTSHYGAVYQTAGRSNILSIATKLMPLNKKNKQEIILNNTVTHLVTNKISRHFLISYRTFLCNRSAPKTSDYPAIIAGREYYVTLNELAHGDLKTLYADVNILNKDELLLNILIQCFLSIYTFHQLDYCHNDCHWGNFLYQKSKNSTGYFHYIIEGEDYFLKNCGYNIMIYDFGLAKPKTALTYRRRILEDYLRILQAFLRRSQGGWISIPGLPKDIVTSYVSHVKRATANMIGVNISETNIFTQNILPAMLATPISGIFIKNLPNQAVILNKNEPFYIDRHHCNVTMINPLSSSLSVSS
jgi:hypothetical protein